MTLKEYTLPYLIDIPEIPDIPTSEIESRFSDYYEYVESIKSRLTDSTYAFASVSRYPEDVLTIHGAWLESLSLDVIASGRRLEDRASDISVRLLGAFHDGYIELRYVNATSFSFVPVQEWQYDEIHLTKEGRVIHTIRFDENSHWIIECDSISHEWKPFRWTAQTTLQHTKLIFRERRILRGPEPWITSVAFSPDGGNLATLSGSGGLLNVRNIEGNPLMAIGGKNTRILRSFAFNPGGSSVAGITENDGTPVVHMWSLPEGHEIGTLVPELEEDDWNQIERITFSPDGSIIACAARRNTTLWSVKTQTVLRRLDCYWSVSFSSDGNTLAGVANGGRRIIDDGAIKIWNVSSGEEVTTVFSPSLSIFRVEFSPDGTKLACIARDYQYPPIGIHLILIWDTRTWQNLCEFRANYDISEIAWHPDSRLLVSAGGLPHRNLNERTGFITAWDSERCWELHSEIASPKPIYSVAFNRDGTLLASAGSDGLLSLWDVNAE
jgi:WD40 repeat protein